MRAESDEIDAHRNARILVVDDSSMVRTTLGRWLHSAGFRCETAPDAEQAITALAARPADLVITDYCLPNQSGLDLLVHLKGRHAEPAVLMLTASGDPDIAMKAMTHGASGYLHKPVQLKDLLIQVRRALETQQKLGTGPRNAEPVTGPNS